MCVLVAQLSLNLCKDMDCSSPGFSVHGILQARILESVALPFSKGSSQLRVEPVSPTLQVDSLPSEPSGKAPTVPQRTIMNIFDLSYPQEF